MTREQYQTVMEHLTLAAEALERVAFASPPSMVIEAKAQVRSATDALERSRVNKA